MNDDSFCFCLDYNSDENGSNNLCGNDGSNLKLNNGDCSEYFIITPDNATDIMSTLG